MAQNQDQQRGGGRAMEDLDWQVLSGSGWPQLRECVYVALVACKRLAGNPVADAAQATMHEILADGAHDPATQVTHAPPAELLRLMVEMTGAADPGSAARESAR